MSFHSTSVFSSRISHFCSVEVIYIYIYSGKILIEYIRRYRIDLVGGLEHGFYDFPYISYYWEFHDPNWLSLYHFSEG